MKIKVDQWLYENVQEINIELFPIEYTERYTIHIEPGFKLKIKYVSEEDSITTVELKKYKKPNIQIITED